MVNPFWHELGPSTANEPQRFWNTSSFPLERGDKPRLPARSFSLAADFDWRCAALRQAESKCVNKWKKRGSFVETWHADLSLCCSCHRVAPVRHYCVFLSDYQCFSFLSNCHFELLIWVFYPNNSIDILFGFRPWQLTQLLAPAGLHRASGLDWPAQGSSCCWFCCYFLSSVAVFLLAPTSQWKQTIITLAPSCCLSSSVGNDHAIHLSGKQPFTLLYINTFQSLGQDVRIGELRGQSSFSSWALTFEPCQH